MTLIFIAVSKLDNKVQGAIASAKMMELNELLDC